MKEQQPAVYSLITRLTTGYGHDQTLVTCAINSSTKTVDWEAWCIYDQAGAKNHDAWKSKADLGDGQIWNERMERQQPTWDELHRWVGSVCGNPRDNIYIILV